MVGHPGLPRPSYALAAYDADARDAEGAGIWALCLDAEDLFADPPPPARGTWIPSARGPGLVDLTLEPWSERPPTAAEEVWDLWGDGRPTEPGLWARCGEEGRRHWLTTALDRHPHGMPGTEPGGTFHLAGRHITDVPGFFCALGEAVNGPGGYFGGGLDALTDCLRGRWGARPPFAFVWHDADTARTCLGLAPLTGRRPWTFEELYGFLLDEGVEVRLA
ncbi:barstar family protein [Streptomyces fructofermentans]|uniref:barstar family protein n=2 Tax=Streptomyces fructofermentans TaxID=152141 RepID=UPI0037B8EBB2